jgi:hypothetical protein
MGPLATIVFNKTGIATFDLSGPVTPGNGTRYYLGTGESFTVTREPETWLTFASGLSILGLVLLR